MAVTWTGWRRFLFGGLWNPERGKLTAGPSLGYSTDSGVVVDDSRAIQISAVLRCIRLIAEISASIPLIGYRKKGLDREPLEADHWLNKLLQEPNETMTGDEWRESMYAHMAGWGNGYSEIVRQGEGRPIELWPYKSANMEVERQRDKTLKYSYPDPDGVRRDLARDKVLHLRAFSLDGDMGVSPLGLARESLGLTVGAESYAASFFHSGGRPSGVMSIERTLTPDQREQVRKEFGGIAEGGKGKRFWILEAAMKYSPITVSPEDMQMLQTRSFQIAEIARFFGVPLFLLMEMEKSTSWGTGIEQQNLAFLAYTLRPYLTRMEISINRKLIPENERGKIFVEHDVTPLLRTDSAARATFYSQMVQNGLMTRNEARRRENLPAIDGADELTAQVNMAPLSKLGQQVERDGNFPT